MMMCTTNQRCMVNINAICFFDIFKKTAWILRTNRVICEDNLPATLSKKGIHNNEIHY